mmetsp:Transcript_4376/g.6557  ORF Transcript_4376/g.6557 Transcript_4376/m.6557 type:complete len:245 (-) Transcript_4376:6-740(-)
MWILTAIPVMWFILYKLNLWLYEGYKSIHQFEAISAMTSSYGSEMYGLNFYIPLNDPKNLKSFMLLRRHIYSHIREQLDNNVQMEVLLTPLIVVSFLIAAVIVVNVLTGDALHVFNVVGFWVLVILTVYLCGILFIAAYGNMIINDEAIATLAKEKFNVSEMAWDKSRKASIIHKRFSAIDTLCAMEMMLDSAILRIRNEQDEGLYIKVFGVPITFATVSTVGTVLVSAISASASQISAHAEQA